MLVSERIGQFFLDTESSRDRLEYTEYGSGESWVVLLHGQLMPRRMHQPLARALAAEGLHVVTLDLLGHGRSDRPADPHCSTIWGRRRPSSAAPRWGPTSRSRSPTSRPNGSAA
jgi:pimeloyl-ACP methyl ester carboxylesterase